MDIQTHRQCYIETLFYLTSVICNFFLFPCCVTRCRWVVRPHGHARRWRGSNRRYWSDIIMTLCKSLRSFNRNVWNSFVPQYLVRALQLHIWWGPSNCIFGEGPPIAHMVRAPPTAHLIEISSVVSEVKHADIDWLYPLTVRYVPCMQREHNNNCANTESLNVLGKLCGACYLASGTVDAVYWILQ